MNSQFVYGQDGDYIPKEIMSFFELTPDDYRYDKDKKYYIYDFVGFVFRKGKILAVFPKHYFEEGKIDVYNKAEENLFSDIKLLYEAITKYSNNKKRKAKASSYLGGDRNFCSDYPFYAFYEIYKYFTQYGLYKEQEELIQPGYFGKVSWKKTIQKAQILVSDGNIVYSPLYVSRNKEYSNFITDCMAFIIDYTITFFTCFISLPKTMYGKRNINYLDHLDFTIRKLHEIKRNIHKDITKELIDNMILFFVQYKSKCIGGNIHVKVDYFNWVWQEAVNEYLNAYFKEVDSITKNIIFDTSQKKSLVEFRQVSYMVDASGNKFEIELDHYGVDKNRLYIFDSKYYQYLRRLNYKQYAYDEILRYSRLGIEELYSALILPGKKESGVHFELKKEYQGTRNYGNVITEQYLCVYDVLKHYVEEN